ncbi:hypothetical protein GH714_038434 [Hevea brasiliensis]|uniref:Uncharacterized protein n=1 Tax=Hevea brasiliensis TaxID=3981 RepID=A0A6A6KGW7_HEVBR|nr:hypothetical protein GH714_038434 [Hevea brasiliensis]
MAARTPTGGLTAIQYEDFKPKSEFKEEEGANILLCIFLLIFIRSKSRSNNSGQAPKWSSYHYNAKTHHRATSNPSETYFHKHCNEGKDKTPTPLEARTEEKMKKQTDGKFEQKPKEDFFAEKVKDVKNAAVAAKKIVMELKEERQSLVNIGQLLLAKGELEQAPNAFKIVLEGDCDNVSAPLGQLDPENAAALVALAVLDLQTNEAEICLISWERPAPSSSRRWRAWSESDDDEVLERKPQASPVGENSTELQESDVEFREDVDI